MIPHTLVCPPNEALLDRLRGRTVVLDAGSPAGIVRAHTFAIDREMRVRCAIARARLPLSHLDIRPEWQGIPIALHLPSFGRFTQIARRLKTLRELDIRLYLPSSAPDGYVGLRVLSSLGIPSALVLDPSGVHWESVSDLMTYALLGTRPHASIEPFQSIADAYAPEQRTEFGAVYFDDPSRYLHLDEAGHVAYSRADLEAGRFCRESPELLDDLESDPEYLERLDAWKQHFLKSEGCAYCPAWRICVGRCEHLPRTNGECTASFTELLELVEQYQANRAERTTTWQP